MFYNYAIVAENHCEAFYLNGNKIFQSYSSDSFTYFYIIIWRRTPTIMSAFLPSIYSF